MREEDALEALPGARQLGHGAGDGDPAAVDPHIIDVIIQSDLIPVVAPIGLGPDGETLNINADTFAAALASALKAKRLLLLTDVEGVLEHGSLRLPEVEATSLVRLRGARWTES